MTRKNDLGAAMAAINKAMEPFELATAAMAVSAVAGAYAAQGKTAVERAAGLGANLETMVSAHNEIVAQTRPKKRAKP